MPKAYTNHKSSRVICPEFLFPPAGVFSPGKQGVCVCVCELTAQCHVVPEYTGQLPSSRFGESVSPQPLAMSARANVCAFSQDHRP